MEQSAIIDGSMLELDASHFTFHVISNPNTYSPYSMDQENGRGGRTPEKQLKRRERDER